MVDFTFYAERRLDKSSDLEARYICRNVPAALSTAEASIKDHIKKLPEEILNLDQKTFLIKRGLRVEKNLVDSRVPDSEAPLPNQQKVRIDSHGLRTDEKREDGRVPDCEAFLSKGDVAEFVEDMFKSLDKDLVEDFYYYPRYSIKDSKGKDGNENGGKEKGGNSGMMIELSGKEKFAAVNNDRDLCGDTSGPLQYDRTIGALPGIEGSYSADSKKDHHKIAQKIWIGV